MLGELQDRLAPFSSAVAYALIEQELGQPVGAVFSVLSPEPVAAASLGQARAGCAAPPAPNRQHDSAPSCALLLLCLARRRIPRLLCCAHARGMAVEAQRSHTPVHIGCCAWRAAADQAAVLRTCGGRGGRDKELSHMRCGAGVPRAAAQHGRGGGGEGAAAGHRRHDRAGHGAAAPPDVGRRREHAAAGPLPGVARRPAAGPYAHSRGCPVRSRASHDAARRADLGWYELAWVTC